MGKHRKLGNLGEKGKWGKKLGKKRGNMSEFGKTESKWGKMQEIWGKNGKKNGENLNRNGEKSRIQTRIWENTEKFRGIWEKIGKNRKNGVKKGIKLGKIDKTG